MKKKTAKSSDTISVWIVEDSIVYQKSIVSLINSQDDMNCSGIFTTCESAMKTIRTFEDEEIPHVVLHDIGFPGLNGITCVDVIKKNFEEIQIIMLTSFDDGEHIFDSLCAGATGYLLKTSTEAEIINGIRTVMAGGSPMNSSIARKVVDAFSRPKKFSKDYDLTDRERNILHFIIRGHTNMMIAAELMLSAHTIDSHLRKIYEKLHVRSRTEAATKAVKERII